MAVIVHFALPGASLEQVYEAEAKFREAIDLDPGIVRAHDGLARILASTSRTAAWSATARGRVIVRAAGFTWAIDGGSAIEATHEMPLTALPPKPMDRRRITEPIATGIRAIEAGWNHSLAIHSDGTLRAWGENFEGQLGDGTTTGRLTPTQVPALTGVTAIATARRQALGQQ